MNRSSVFAFAIALVAGCAAAPSTESEYNQGVDAYRVKDYAAARLHWSKAVEERELSALNNLGYLLYYGLGGSTDEGRAVQLWTRAAELGHSESQWHLGRAFEDGTGPTQNLPQAYAVLLRTLRRGVRQPRCRRPNRPGCKQVAHEPSPEVARGSARCRRAIG